MNITLQVPDMPNINNVLTTVGHRFGHQSSLGKSSGKNDNFSIWNCVTRLFDVLKKKQHIFTAPDDHRHL